jgi:hypothetical protein
MLSLFEVSYDHDEPPMFVLAESLPHAIKKYKEDVVECVNSDHIKHNSDARITLVNVEDPVAVVHVAYPENVIL